MRNTFVMVPLTLVLAGCSAQPNVERTSAARPSSPRTSMLVSTGWLADHLDDSQVVILHVARNREGYEREHIEGARFVSWEDITRTRDGVENELPPLADLVQLLRRLGIGNDSRVVIYDEELGIAAARAYVTLDYLGMGDRTALLNGQLATWKAEGRPLSTRPPAVQASDFVPRIRPEVIVHLQQVHDLVQAKNDGLDVRTAIVDARSPEQYAGTDPGRGIPRGGHIPGAVNVFSNDTLLSRDRPILRPADQLRQLYVQSDIKPDQLVVTYCRTGGQGSLSYFVLKYLGYDVRLYDGSFSEWSQTADTPVSNGP